MVAWPSPRLSPSSLSASPWSPSRPPSRWGSAPPGPVILTAVWISRNSLLGKLGMENPAAGGLVPDVAIHRLSGDLDNPKVGLVAKERTKGIGSVELWWTLAAVRVGTDTLLRYIKSQIL